MMSTSTGSGPSGPTDDKPADSEPTDGPRRKYGDPETREEILRTAWRILEETRGLTLAGVARAAGVSRQAIYLHFDDRAGLLLALVRFMDDNLGLGESLFHVFAAERGIDAMDRAVVVYGRFNPGIDAAARILEVVEGPDDPLAIAWRDRMTFRLGVHREIVARIDAEGMLAEGWTVEHAADLFHSVTLPAVWRELTAALGWSTDDYVKYLQRMLRQAFVK